MKKNLTRVTTTTTTYHSDTADGPDADNEKRNSPNAELDYEYTQDVD